MAQLFKGVK